MLEVCRRIVAVVTRVKFEESLCVYLYNQISVTSTTVADCDLDCAHCFSSSLTVFPFTHYATTHSASDISFHALSI